MSADGAILNVEIFATAVTLADVIDHLEHDVGLAPRCRREMCSAIRTIARVLGKDPSTLPAQPRHLRQLLAAVTAAGAGVSDGRWSNVRSLVFKAISHAGIKTMPGRYREPLAPEWEALRARLPDRRFQSGLSRFMSYCTARGFAASAVTAATFVEFGAELEAHSMSRDPGGLYRDTCKLWNQATTIAGWPRLQVEVPVRRRDFSLSIDAFPDSFREDVERFLTQGADPDVFSDSYSKPVRPLTVRNRRRNIMMAATALVRSGFPADQITGLDVLVRFGNAKVALHFLYDRAGRKTTGHIYQIATLLKTISRHHVHSGEEAIEPLRKLCMGLKPNSAGLTEKNKRFLRQFADLEKLVALLTLPAHIIDGAEQHLVARRRDAVRVELAVGVAIELLIPIRVDNLAGLRLDEHLQFVGDRAYLSIPAHMTKNDNAIDAELSPHMARQLRLYVEKIRPRLIGAPSPWLFPGEAGKRRRSGGFGAQLSSFIAKETGVTMTVHQFRHLRRSSISTGIPTASRRSAGCLATRPSRRRCASIAS